MLPIAQLKNTDIAAIAAFSSMITAIIASGVSWWNGHHKNEVDENASLFHAYNDVVQNLQTEVSRLQNELSLIREEMKKCENSNKRLSDEIKKLQNCVSNFTDKAKNIETTLHIEIPPSEEDF